MGSQSSDGISLAEFFRKVDAQGVIPVSMIYWQLTGKELWGQSQVPE
jgi:hypothetical protein